MMCHYDVVREAESHLRDIRQMAEQDRLARQVLGPRPLRRRMGRLLIAVGETLASHRIEEVLTPAIIVPPAEAAPADNVIALNAYRSRTRVSG